MDQGTISVSMLAWPMVQFYFHVLNDVFFAHDEDGIPLPDLPAARDHARKILAGIIAEELTEGRNMVNLCIMVDDHEGMRVADIKSTTKVQLSENPFAEV